MLKTLGPLWLVTLALSLQVRAVSADEMGQIVKNIKVAFHDYYAPKQWKATTFQWDLDAELAKLSAASMGGDVSAFHEGLLDFFQATRDYHTSIRFADNTTATLPLSIKHIDGEFYVAHIAPGLANNISLKLGDKITHINDRDVKDLAHELMGNLDKPSATDWALAAMKLTKRSGMRLDPIEKGTVIIKALHKDEDVIAQLVWNVSYGWNGPTTMAQTVADNKLIRRANFSASQREALEGMFDHIDRRSFRLAFADSLMASGGDSDDPLALGKKESFLPALGDYKVWEADSENPFDAYVYLNDDKKLIGFIRLPSFVPESASLFVEKFGETIDKMDDITDVLVIDQLNNPGGSVFYLYAIASMLAEKPLVTPKHRFTIDSEDVWAARQFLDSVDLLIMLAQALPVQLGEVSGYPLDLQFLLHMKSYFQFVVEQWNQGKTFTDPYYLYGVDYIQPHAKYRYTKKIVLLTNELDFSGGDFFPAIMQDNNRVTTLGSTTAGAGGYVLANSDRNRTGVLAFSYTGSIAFRANGEPLENLGVQPDIEYAISALDLAGNFKYFKQKINQVVETLY